MSRNWTAGSSTRWRKIRTQVLIRDGYVCQLAYDGCTRTAGTVHHVSGRAVTGDNPAALVAACASCNGKAGDPGRSDPKPRGRTVW